MFLTLNPVMVKPAPWPFPPRLLDYSVQPPGVKPYRPPQPKPELQDLPPALL